MEERILPAPPDTAPAYARARPVRSKLLKLRIIDLNINPAPVITACRNCIGYSVCIITIPLWLRECCIIFIVDCISARIMSLSGPTYDKAVALIEIRVVVIILLISVVSPVYNDFSSSSWRLGAGKLRVACSDSRNRYRNRAVCFAVTVSCRCGVVRHVCGNSILTGNDCMASRSNAAR